MRTAPRELHIQVNVYIGKVKTYPQDILKRWVFSFFLKVSVHFSVFMSNGNDLHILGPETEKDDLRVCVFLQKSEFRYSVLDDLNGLSCCLDGSSS